MIKGWIILLYASCVFGDAVFTTFYDNRDCGVTFCIDDLRDETVARYMAMVDFCASNGIVTTVGINPNSCTETTYAAVNARTAGGFVSVANHSYKHTAQAVYTEADLQAVTEEVTLADDAILANINQHPWNSYNGADNVVGWIMPGSAYGRTNEWWQSVITSNLVERGYLADRTTTYLSAWATKAWAEWETNIYERVQNIRSGGTESDNKAWMDAALTNGIMLNIYNHPWQDAVSIGDDDAWYNILKYIGRRPNVWYVGWGESYMYRYTTENAVIALDESNPVVTEITISIDQTSREKYSCSYPITVAYDLPSGWSTVRAVDVVCVAEGETNSVPERYGYQMFSGVNAARIDLVGRTVYVSQSFAQTGTNMVIRITPRPGGIPRYAR
jgi:hypothetical protein